MSNEQDNTVSLSAALDAHTQAQADAALAALVDQVLQASNLERPTAEAWVRRDIAYATGRYDHATRRRVEKLYKCAHPLFGAIEANAPPTPEQASTMGRELAERRLSADEMQRVSYLVPRVDAQRAEDRITNTGIYIRAIGTDGKWAAYDIEMLTRDSLLGWMQQQPRKVLERLVLALFDHPVSRVFQEPPEPT